jgi:polar amino acid transport system substrate-binding protein
MKVLRLLGCIIILPAFALPSHRAAADTIRVAVLERFPPFIAWSDGRAAGPLVDKLLAAAKNADLKIAFVSTTLDQWQKVIAEGRADAFFPMAITASFQQSYDFSEPVMSSGGGLFVRAPEQTPSDLAALEEKIVVTPQTGPLAAYIAKTAPRVKLVVTKDYDESFAKLLSGEADAAALNLQVGTAMVTQLYSGKITPAAGYFWELPLALVVPKGKDGPPSFLDKLNREIVAQRASNPIAQ